jgi:hypothetical protein
MEVTIPHQLGREEVRRRLRNSDNVIGDSIPGGMADVRTSWPEEDRMAMSINIMGQLITGDVEVGEETVRFVITLPPMLTFVEPMVRASVKQGGLRLVAPEPE